eukprot:TRINITY_DN3297_c0_g1_i1.p1 TRINITY_DN3297_c0_g1~~TRINITY_DN3297_c0_g1_i1.p1  ORF type:complete len:163 (-),score=31.93 TRINITY_DN3297_c0_g1_i1:584-1051(-)
MSQNKSTNQNTQSGGNVNAEDKLRKVSVEGAKKAVWKLTHLNMIFQNCVTLEDIKEVRSRCYIVVNCLQILNKYPIETKDSFNPRLHKNVEQTVIEFRIKMDQALWKIISKVKQLSWVLGKRELSNISQLKAGTLAIRAVLAELKNIKPDNFLQL